GVAATSDPLRPGSMVEVNGGAGLLTVEALVADEGGRRYFRARGAHGEGFTLVELAQANALTLFQKLPDRRVLRMSAEVAVGGRTVRVYPRVSGITVREWVHDVTPPDPLDVLHWGIQLCEVVENIHGAGLCVYSLDPDAVLRTPSLDAVLVGLERLPHAGEPPLDVHTATAAPEVVHRVAPLCGIPSDVYTVAAVIHAVLAGREFWPPPPGMSAVLVHQQSPRTFRPELPLGIWPRLAPALHPDPTRRMPHLAALKEALRGAQTAVQLRGSPARGVRVDGWQDTHIGVGKARRGGVQQDRVYLEMTGEGALAVGAVADGVSHAILGDGGTAAQHTAEAVSKVAQLVFDSVGQPRSQAERHGLLQQALDNATDAICQDANTNYPPLTGDTSGVMASTLVMTLVEDGVASILSVGDSRVYLFDGEVCEAVTVDHDRRTEAMRAGMDAFSAASLEAGGALTRAVGRVLRDMDGRLVSSPSAGDYYDVPLLPGDRLLLCSDGLPDYALPLGQAALSPCAVEDVLAEVLQRLPDPASASHELIGLANSNGGHDNVSVVLLVVREAP
ncbi:MAG: protein phosphatase 2C domain-containing protein, partial [Myxococcota bacterium]